MVHVVVVAMEHNQMSLKQLAKVVPGEKLELVVHVVVVAMEENQMDLKQLVNVVSLGNMELMVIVILVLLINFLIVMVRQVVQLVPVDEDQMGLKQLANFVPQEQLELMVIVINVLVINFLLVMVRQVVHVQMDMEQAVLDSFGLRPLEQYVKNITIRLANFVQQDQLKSMASVLLSLIHISEPTRPY